MSKGTSSSRTSASPPARGCPSCGSTTGPRHAAEGRAAASSATPCSSCTAPAAPARSSPGANFAGELFGPGQPLDASKYFIILPDDIGHGRSSKPSDGLRAKFPRYGYVDMVEAEHRLVTEGLGRQSPAPGDGHVDGRHAHVDVGRALSRLHGRADAAREPADADRRTQPRLAPRRHRCDPQRSRVEGRRTTRRSRRACARPRRCCGWWAATRSSARRQAPTLADADRVLDDYVASYLKTGDANDILYALEASRDYDPGPGPREDHRAARRDQLGRRHHQSAGAADPRARDQARAARARPSSCRSATGPPATARTRRPRCGSSTWWNCSGRPNDDLQPWPLLQPSHPDQISPSAD